MFYVVTPTKDEQKISLLTIKYFYFRYIVIESFYPEMIMKPKLDINFSESCMVVLVEQL